MALDLSDCQFQGPALPEPFVKLELEKELLRLKLLPKTTGAEGKELAEHWDVYRRKLRELAASGGSLRVRNHVIEPLQPLLGYAHIESAPDVQTREDLENGGALFSTEDGKAKLRVWTTTFNEDLYAPSKRGRAYRYSHLRVVQRVLLASGERMGLLTNGIQLLILISDPARPDSTVTIPLDPGWKRSRDVPDSFRLLIALTSPKGVASLSDLVEKARLQQARVTKELRKQAREAVEHFTQEILDHPANQEWFKAHADHHALARTLWREGLVTIYRLLFILKLEASDDAARSFSFASTSLWRNTFSPSMALARYAHDVLERGLETGTLLEAGLRTLFRMFEQGLECTELVVKPLGGALFGINATPTLAQLIWGERAVAWLLDRLLWTPQRRGEATRQRVHYGPLDVEDLGRVYEALLELEPGITEEPMSRLRRQKLEVVVPLAQGEKYRPALAVADSDSVEEESEEPAEEEVEEEEQPSRGKKTKVEWIEAIQPGRFYLRVGLGRKASGSYYTPHSFVRFLVQETLGPQVAERSPHDDPQPLKILELKVLDPAMGSGHFLVEACRFLGDKLYEACRLCDDKALAAERRAEKATKAEKEKALTEAANFRQRILDLPDPDDELVRYLPSRSPEGEESGFSQQRAEALCRRLVATHCLYGVDKNPLAVELAKLALWLESHAEGMPLTFLDHRLVVGDSLTGAFWDKLIFRPGKPTELIANLFHQDLDKKLRHSLHDAIRYVNQLEATVGISVAEMHEKERLKAKLDRAILPFRVAAAAWSGGVMLGSEQCDDHAYAELLQTIGNTGDLSARIKCERLRDMIARGLGIDEAPGERETLYWVIGSGCCIPALPYDLTFPEVFYPTGVPYGRQGFHVVLGNPPWDQHEVSEEEFLASYDFELLERPGLDERERAEHLKTSNTRAAGHWNSLVSESTSEQRAFDSLYERQVVEVAGRKTSGKPDLARLFMERNIQLVNHAGHIGCVVPGSFHNNEGVVGIRRLYLGLTRDSGVAGTIGIQHYIGFRNYKRRFFPEVHTDHRFAVLVASRALDQSQHFRVGFHLTDEACLFDSKAAAAENLLTFSRDFVQQTGGPYLVFIEFRSQEDLDITTTAANTGTALGSALHDIKLSIGQGMSTTRDRWRRVSHAHWTTSIRFYRACQRRIGSSTNTRSGVFAMLPPGCVAVESLRLETAHNERPNLSAFLYIGVGSSFAFDYMLRQRVYATQSEFLINTVSWPRLQGHCGILVHGSLRLLSNHAGFACLWREQLGDTWREPGKKPLTWPVLPGDDERWEVRGAIDAVVAAAYGLSREQFAHVLSTFSHASYLKAPELCLARFDELKSIGLDAFTKKYDPYWDIPLNENPPKPVIDLPMTDDQEASLFQTREAAPKKRGRKKA
jgi:hypothetical protein